MFFDRDHLLAQGTAPFCVSEDGKALSYADLVARVDRFAARLSAGRGLLLLRAPSVPDTVIAFLAALQSQVPVLLTAPDRPQEDAGLIATFPVRYVYDPDTNDLEVLEDSDGAELHPDLALLLSTSGSTGAAKCIRLSHTNIASNAQAIAEYLALTPGDRAPTNLPIYYSYGLSVVTSHLAAGGSLMFTRRTVLEPDFWRAFDAQGCTSFAAVPHVIDSLEKSPFRTADRPTLRYATQAGGKLAPDRVAEIAARSRAETWDFFVMYGQTEASPRMAYLPPDQALDNPGCIGLPIPGGTFALVDEDGREITTPETTGELFYRGPNVMMGYATQGADLARGAEVDALHTGDMAVRTRNGLYRIVGRKSRFVKPFGLRVSLDEVDAWLSGKGHGAVSGAGREERLWLLTLPETDAAAVRRDLADWLGVPETAIHTTPVDRIPLGDNGKIDGRAVNRIVAEAEAALPPDGAASAPERDWGDRLFAGLAAGWHRIVGSRKANAGPQTAGLPELERIFQRHFPGATITPETSFSQQQGDSLRYLSVALDLEKALGQLPEDWQDMPLRELAGRAGSQGPVYIDMPTLLRCLSITLIVATHLNVIRYPGGGAMLLFTLAGFSFAAYQIPTILRSGSTLSVFSQALRVAIPAMLYLALLGPIFFEFDLRVIFLFSNWIDPHLHNNYAAWFIDVYVQTMLLMGVIFLLGPVRRAFDGDGFPAAVVFALFAIAFFRISHEFWDTHYLYRRLPHMMLWLFALGMAIHFADRTGRKIIVTALAVLGLMLFSEDWARGFLRWFTPGVILLIWTTRLEVPRWAAGGIRRIAGASLFIYLTHFQWASVSRILFGERPIMPVILALAGGVLCWIVWEWIQKQALSAWSRWRAGERPIYRPSS